MPDFLRLITGDAKAVTNGPANAKAQWTCTGFTNRRTTKYPLCPRGSQVQRILDFPSCWDGAEHRQRQPPHARRFPDADGRCPEGTKADPAAADDADLQRAAGTVVRAGHVPRAEPQPAHRPRRLRQRDAGPAR